MGNIIMKKKAKERMQNVTIALPEFYVLHLEKLRKNGIIPNRSEGIRLALRRLILKERDIYNFLNEFQ